MTTSLSPDEELVGQVHRLFNLARDARREVTAQWKDNWRILNFRPGPAGSAASKKVPEIQPVVSAIVAWETDSEPAYDVTPFAQRNTPYYQFYDQLSNDLSTILRAAHANNRWGSAITQAMWNANTYSLGILKSTWDESLVGGLGDVSMKSIDPFTLYIDPSVTDPYDANYFIEVRTMSMQSLERMVPDIREKVTGSSVLQADMAPSVMNDTEGASARAANA